MDGIEKITGRIAADTEAEIASIQAEARRQADEITARYEAQAKRDLMFPTCCIMRKVCFLSHSCTILTWIS